MLNVINIKKNYGNTTPYTPSRHMDSLILFLASADLIFQSYQIYFCRIFIKKSLCSREIKQRNFYHIILSLLERLVPSFFPLTRYLILKINNQFVTTVERIRA